MFGWGEGHVGSVLLSVRLPPNASESSLHSSTCACTQRPLPPQPQLHRLDQRGGRHRVCADRRDWRVQPRRVQALPPPQGCVWLSGCLACLAPPCPAFFWEACVLLTPNHRPRPPKLPPPSTLPPQAPPRATSSTRWTTPAAACASTCGTPGQTPRPRSRWCLRPGS